MALLQLGHTVPSKQTRLKLEDYFCYFDFISLSSFFVFNLIKRYLIPINILSYKKILKSNIEIKVYEEIILECLPKPLDSAENFIYLRKKDQLNLTMFIDFTAIF